MCIIFKSKQNFSGEVYILMSKKYRFVLFVSFFVISFSVFLFVLSGSSFAEGLKIAIVTSPNDVHDGGFNESN